MSTTAMEAERTLKTYLNDSYHRIAISESDKQLLVCNGYYLCPDGAIKCFWCSSKLFDIHPNILSKRDMMKAHHVNCKMGRQDLDYIVCRAIEIEARRAQGVDYFDDKVILEVTRKGYSKDTIITACVYFFLFNGAYPRTSKEVEEFMQL